MTEFESTAPVILSFSSHDPSGSTGIQADIECAASLGCHCTPIITALCAKDTRDTKEILPVASPLLIEQARAILEDMQVKAVKVGYTGSIENVEAIHSILRDYPSLPVVLDPGTHVCGTKLADAPGVLGAIETLLLPLATVTTPDLAEAHELAQQGDTIHACAQEILEHGCEYVLISGAERSQSTFENHLFGKQGLIQTFSHKRLKMPVSGCGATLAASIACYLGHGLRTEEAIIQGQNFTWNSLANSRQLGMGRRTPNRFFWATKNSGNQSTGNG
ncbi:bifunctional hydroxymethylpyrimidine kinase/phosphomethylpyrimidine kinase [Pseudomaricurvus sp.]|uniref:bifunctional hydroxymethylpyrimidine kinase/phosphomethylpyrimidine kinase n=1 Tax=Pseudomaricurvus sp. TaxID=2004510 RepID=UPI003F6A7714